jgi:hypothetical protein
MTERQGGKMTTTRRMVLFKGYVLTPQPQAQSPTPPKIKIKEAQDQPF